MIIWRGFPLCHCLCNNPDTLEHSLVHHRFVSPRIGQLVRCWALIGQWYMIGYLHHYKLIPQDSLPVWGDSWCSWHKWRMLYSLTRLHTCNISFPFKYNRSKPNYYLACPSLIGQSNPNNSSAVQPSLNKIIILISQCQDYLSTCWQCQGAHSLQFVHQRRGDSDRWPVSPLRCCTPHTGYTCSPRPTYHSSGDSCQPETFESDNDDFSASTSTSWYQLTGSGCWRRSLPLCSHPTLNGRPHCWLMVSKTRPSSHRNSALRSPCSSHMWNLSHCFLSGTKYLNPELRHGDEGSEEAPRTWRTAIIEAEINVVDNIT